MVTKFKEFDKAVILRKQGFTYSEILREVHVAKSTLARWLHTVELAARQKQQLTEKKRLAQLRGIESIRKRRIEKIQKIHETAVSEVGKLSRRDLWLVGTTLYWAEGSKMKVYRTGQSLIFSNSDPVMIRLFLKWLQEVCEVDIRNIDVEIYLHENSSADSAKVFWARQTSLPQNRFVKVYWKRHNPSTRRKNVGVDYHGLLRVRVRKSTDLNRRVSGWIAGMAHRWEVV